ncbi:MAG: hypothetical protein PHH37_04710 [Paludibacter sp.]|nr:hypothetical protein [Paludibacter sp.]
MNNKSNYSKKKHNYFSKLFAGIKKSTIFATLLEKSITIRIQFRRLAQMILSIPITIGRVVI